MGQDDWRTEKKDSTGQQDAMDGVTDALVAETGCGSHVRL